MNEEFQSEKRKISKALKVDGFYDIFKIVLTGGPCAGKTTSITTLSDKLREKGYATYIVPEAASLVFSSGSSILCHTFSEESQIKFQYYLMMM